jgi:hypothetical protein
LNYRITDMDEYNAEIERRRQLGLTIDPATAETTFWFADISDPYDILDPKHHEGQVGRERFSAIVAWPTRRAHPKPTSWRQARLPRCLRWACLHPMGRST